MKHPTHSHLSIYLIWHDVDWWLFQLKLHVIHGHHFQRFDFWRWKKWPSVSLDRCLKRRQTTMFLLSHNGLFIDYLHWCGHRALRTVRMAIFHFRKTPIPRVRRKKRYLWAGVRIIFIASERPNEMPLVFAVTYAIAFVVGVYRKCARVWVCVCACGWLIQCFVHFVLCTKLQNLFTIKQNKHLPAAEMPLHLIPSVN